MKRTLTALCSVAYMLLPAAVLMAVFASLYTYHPALQSPPVTRTESEYLRAISAVIDREARALSDASCVPARNWHAPRVPGSVIVQDYGAISVHRYSFEKAWDLSQKGKVVTLYICKE